ncbi:MAG: hypothetical protein AB7F88_19760 [Pyrinomonadaceae bacterium]
MSKCRAYDCRETVEDGVLMCPKHWAFVSQETRLELKATAGNPGSLDHVKAANKAKMEAAKRGRFSRHQLARMRKAQRTAESIVARKEIERLKSEFSARSADKGVHPSGTDG